MDDLFHLDYLDGRPALPAPPGWGTFTAWTAWMGNLHCPDYLDGQPRGWTTFAFLGAMIQ
eukprot:1444434-Karenia_brevis.AAC.1